MPKLLQEKESQCQIFHAFPDFTYNSGNKSYKYVIVRTTHNTTRTFRSCLIVRVSCRGYPYQLYFAFQIVNHVTCVVLRYIHTYIHTFIKRNTVKHSLNQRRCTLNKYRNLTSSCARLVYVGIVLCGGERTEYQETGEETGPRDNSRLYKFSL